MQNEEADTSGFDPGQIEIDRVILRGHAFSMCGICGIMNLDGSRIDSSGLIKMRDNMPHRGPDHKGAVFLSAKSKEQEIMSIKFKDVERLLA